MNARRAGGRIPPEERSVVSTMRGLPWWTITPLAVALALTGVAIDTSGSHELGRAFTVMFFAGCVTACLVAARKAVFAAGIQPPIIMTVLVPLVYMISGGAGSGETFSRTQLIGAVLPLVTRFPLMAVTTAVTIAVCLVRAFVLEPRRGHDRGREKPRNAHRAPRRRADEQRPARHRTAARRSEAPQRPHAAAGRERVRPESPDRTPVEDSARTRYADPRPDPTGRPGEQVVRHRGEPGTPGERRASTRRSRRPQL